MKETNEQENGVKPKQSPIFFFVHSLECINSRKLNIYFQEKWFCSIRSCVAAAKCEFIDILSFLFGIFFCWTITIHCQKLRKYGESFFITIEARNWNDSKNRHSMHNKNRTHSCFSVLYYFYVVSCGNANKIRYAFEISDQINLWLENIFCK